MRSKVNSECVRLLRDLDFSYTFVNAIKRGTKILEAKRNTSHDALSSITSEENGVWVPTAVNQESQFSLSKVLNFIDIQTVYRPWNISDITKTFVEVLDKITLIKENTTATVSLILTVFFITLKHVVHFVTMVGEIRSKSISKCLVFFS